MSFTKYLWKNMFRLLLAASVLSMTLGTLVTGIVVGSHQRASREEKLDSVVRYVQEVLRSCSHQIRDLSNDSTLCDLYDSFTEIEGIGKYANLDSLKAYLTRVAITQDAFKYILFQTDEFSTLHSKSYIRASHTSIQFDGRPGETPMDVLCRLVDKEYISQYRLVSTNTNDDMTLTGLIDLKGLLDDTMKRYVVYDESNNILYNGMDELFTRREVQDFIASEADVLKMDGVKWRADIRADGDLRFALFYEDRFFHLTPENIAISLGLTIATMLFSLIWLRNPSRHFRDYLNELKLYAADQSRPLKRRVNRRPRIVRQAREMQSWLWSVLIRICIPPILILVSFNCLMGIHLQREQLQKDTFDDMQWQIDVLDRKYQHCVSFLRNASIDYMLQDHISRRGYATDMTFIREYSSILWNKCSEWDLLSSIAIFDTDWNRIYLTGDADIAANDEVYDHFDGVFNKMYVVSDSDRIICYLAIRNAGMIQKTQTNHFEKFGYIAIALADPAAHLTSELADMGAAVTLGVGPDADQTDADNRKAVVITRTLSALNRHISVEVPSVKGLNGEMRTTIIFFAILLVALLCLLILTAQRISSHMLRALELLKNNLDGVYSTERENAMPAPTGILEFDELTEYFGHLMRSLADKQNALSQKHLELLKEQKARVDLQLAAIESQLSPHFLFNIFTSIRFLLEEKKFDDAKEMLKLTAQMFRSFLYHGQTLITLDAEIKHVGAYMQVQCFRFGGQLRLDMQGQDVLTLGALLPQFTLQPLIENAIEHALPNCARLTIGLTVNRSDGDLWICISDDGGGMNDADIQRMRELLTGDGDPHSHCGLLNIHKRLKLHFGPQYGLRFARNEQNGLTVTVHVPFRNNPADFEQGGEDTCSD